MENCIFCRVANKQVPHFPIYEDDDVLSFLDAFPTVEGHTLVIPKKHFAHLSNTPDEIRIKMLKAVDKITPVLKEVTESTYIMIMIAGIDIEHFHIHLIPKKTDSPEAPKPNMTSAKFEKLRAKIAIKMPA